MLDSCDLRPAHLDPCTGPRPGPIYLVTNQGTLRLGTSPFAQAVWHSANYVDTEEEAC